MTDEGDTCINVVKVVGIPLDALIDGNVETLNDHASEAVTNGRSHLLQDISYHPVGHQGDDVLLRVEGFIDTSGLDDEEVATLREALDRPEPHYPPTPDEEVN